jgi:hypothetical protein
LGRKRQITCSVAKHGGEILFSFRSLLLIQLGKPRQKPLSKSHIDNTSEIVPAVQTM